MEQVVRAARLPTHREVHKNWWQRQSQGPPFHVAPTRSGRQKGGWAMGEAWVLHDGQDSEAFADTPVGAAIQPLVPLGPLFQNKFYHLGEPVRDPKTYIPPARPGPPHPTRLPSRPGPQSYVATRVRGFVATSDFKCNLTITPFQTPMSPIPLPSPTPLAPITIPQDIIARPPMSQYKMPLVNYDPV